MKCSVGPAVGVRSRSGWAASHLVFLYQGMDTEDGDRLLCLMSCSFLVGFCFIAADVSQTFHKY
jgi:hypothetical protein